MNETSKDNKNIIVDKVMSLRDDSISGWREATQKSILVQDFIRHEPYTEEQKIEAEKFHKPLLRYNVLVAKLLGLEGQELVNRRKTIFEPRYAASSDLVRILSDGWDYINNREELITKLIKSMVDGLCYPRMGWTRRKLVMDDYGYLTFSYSNEDTFLVHADPTFKKLDLSDCSFVILDEWMTMDRINESFKPNPFSPQEERFAYQMIRHRQGGLQPYYGEHNTIDGDRYLVCQAEERVTKAVDICEVDGEFQALTTEEADKLADGGAKVEYVKRGHADRIKVTTILPSHNLVLQDTEYNYDTKRFSFFPCASYDWVMEKRKQPSLMYIMTDIQDAISKGKSQHLDFMIQQLVEDYNVPVSEEQAIKDIEGSKGDPFKLIKWRNINNYRPRQSGAPNAGALSSIQNDIYMSLDFMAEVSNITPSMEGKAGKSGESGALFNAKVERGITTTNPYYEIKAKVNLLLAKDYLELAKDVFFEDDRIIEKKYDPKTGLSHEMVNMKIGGIVYNDVRKAKLEAILDEGENTEAHLERTFQENLAFAQLLLNANVPPETIDWADIVEHSNLRDKTKWVESLRNAKNLMELYAKEALAGQRLAQEEAIVPPQQQTQGE